MKRYLVFYGQTYYPWGGWSDFHGDFDTVELAKDFLLGKTFDWFQVVDSQTGAIVSQRASDAA